MTTLPAWVIHALDEPPPTGGGLVRAARCPYCYRVVLRARDHFDMTCDPHPLTAVGEVLAIADGRTTYMLTPARYGSPHKTLTLRLPMDIRRYPVGTPRRPHGPVDVIADHSCQDFTYPTTPSAYTPPRVFVTASREEGTFDDEPPY